jgi:hypothetical protein
MPANGWWRHMCLHSWLAGFLSNPNNTRDEE